MRVAFFGTPDFAVPALAALLDAGHDVVTVVTQPDRPRGRSHSTLLPPPVKQFAIERQLPVLQPERPRGNEFVDSLAALDLDCAVVVAYGHLLRPELLAVARHGFVNVHASLLPRWRGAAPIQWAILSDDRETGIAIMRIEAGLDTGAVWRSTSLVIGDDDTAATLTRRLAHLGAQTLIEALPEIAAGVDPVPQPAAGVTLAPKVDRQLARVDWHAQPRTVSCLMRAMDPAPGAWSSWEGTDIKLFVPRLADVNTNPPDLPPGTVTPIDGGIAVRTGAGWIGIGEVQPAGRRRMAALDWWRGSGVHAPQFS